MTSPELVTELEERYEVAKVYGDFRLRELYKQMGFTRHKDGHFTCNTCEADATPELMIPISIHAEEFSDHTGLGEARPFAAPHCGHCNPDLPPVTSACLHLPSFQASLDCPDVTVLYIYRQTT